MIENRTHFQWNESTNPLANPEYFETVTNEDQRGVWVFGVMPLRLMLALGWLSEYAELGWILGAIEEREKK